MLRPRIEVSLAINAPLAQVWGVMMDVHRYGDWNPFIVRVEGVQGDPRVGQSMKLHVKWNDGKGVVSSEEFSRIEPPHKAGNTQRALLEYAFRGPLHTLGLVRGSRIQTLVQQDGGPTFYKSEEEFRGLLTFGLPLAKVRDGFERHAQALKARAESAVT